MSRVKPRKLQLLPVRIFSTTLRVLSSRERACFFRTVDIERDLFSELSAFLTILSQIVSQSGVTLALSPLACVVALAKISKLESNVIEERIRTINRNPFENRNLFLNRGVSYLDPLTIRRFISP